jgi:serine/threonine protein kinase
MPADDQPMRPGGPREVHEYETVLPARGADFDEAERGDGASPGVFASLDEFSHALVEIGLISDEEKSAFAADSAEGVLGLSRALVKSGKLTPYQAAAVYQKKSRGLLIGNYLILDKIGQGGMGMVFKARHRLLGRVGALKILPPSFARDRDAVKRFRREVEAAGRVKHPNLVAAQDADEDRGVHFLVMDYVDGRDLDRIVQDRGPMQVNQAVDCLIQAARGLEAAHSQGIIHRDIKPANLMLEDSGTVRVLDLGLARIVDAANPFGKSAAGRLTQSGMYMGTIDFMAPEQAEDSHRVDHRADIYSLGCTLYYLLTGKAPFPGETVLKRLMAHMERPAPSLRLARRDVPSALEEAYEKMMAKRREDRPASITELIALLEAARKAPAPAPPQGVGTAGLKSKPELEVFDEAILKRAGAPKTKAEPSIFAQPKKTEGLMMGTDISLEDLVMDVRPEVRPAPMPAAPEPRPGGAPPLKRLATARGRRKRKTGGLVIVGLAAAVILVAAVAGLVLTREGSRAGPKVAGTPTDTPEPPVGDTTKAPPSDPTIASPKKGAAITGAEPKQDHSAPAARKPALTKPLPTPVQTALTTNVATRSNLVGTDAINKRLDESLSFRFPDATPLMDVLKYIKKATRKGANDPGIPIYVDPIGLQAARKAMTSTVKIDADGRPLKVVLKQIVDQLGLAYVVKDDVLIISERRVLVQMERQKTAPSADTLPATNAVVAKLAEPIAMPFASSTQLIDVLKYLITSTKKSTNEPALTISVDPLGLQQVEKTMNSTIVIDLEGVPLRTSLRLLLRQLGLAYTVKNGALVISSSDRIRGGQQPIKDPR